MEIRRATDGDIEQIVALQRARNGDDTEPLVRDLMADEQIGARVFTVAVEGDRVVSSLCLLPATLRMEGIDIPAGQPEFVATVEDYGNRGLVRAQMDEVHRWSVEQGELVQIIAGIPYFYRLFGYEYAIPFPRIRMTVPGWLPPEPDGWSVRDAVAADIPEIMRLQAGAQSHVPLALTRSERQWGHQLRTVSKQRVVMAEHGGAVKGTAIIGPGPPGADASVTVGAAAVSHPDAIRAFIAEAARDGRPVAILERRGTAVDGLDAITAVHPRQYALYVRVPDPVALLDRLIPVLSARLARSPYAASRGRLLLSLYRSTVRISYEDGVITAVEGGPGEQNPAARGGAGVPPDLVATLIFGRFGASGLAARHDDVALGAAAGVMDTLFPHLVSDVSLNY